MFDYQLMQYTLKVLFPVMMTSIIIHISSVPIIQDRWPVIQSEEYPDFTTHVL